MKGIEKQKKLFRYGVFLTALPLSFASFSCGRGKTDASAADQYFEGTSVACVSALRETPVGIESARISFGVPRYGVQSYGKEAPSFQATYVFYNPTDKDETLSLAFPYELIGRGYGREEERDWNNEGNCSIRSEENDIAYDAHYTYKSHGKYEAPFYTFSLPDRSAADSFYKEDLSVYKYTYRITMSEQNDAESFVKVYIKGTPRTKIMREKDCASAFVENAYRCLGYVVKNGGREITYYSIGGESEISCLSCDGGGAEFAAELVDKSCETFKAFAEAFRPDGVFSEEDWYWIAVDFFNDTVYKGALLPPLSYVQDCSFVRWYFYELAVPAGAIKENTVSAPLYPASSQDANRFRCQISSLSSFPFFGGITVEVNTPLNMSYSSLEFTKEENVFSFRREELPFGELSFVLSETKGEGVFGAEGRRLDPMLLSIILLSVAVAGAIVATTVLYVKNKRARAISARKQTRAQMGRPEEGKIEDGSFQNRKE